MPGGERSGTAPGTSLRSRSAAATLLEAAAPAAALGITRLTDITRMDRLGVPVFASVRPRGLTLRVHAGKGVIEADARVGALMEALEYAVAESAAQQAPDGRSTLRRLLAAWPGGLGPQHFAPTFDTAIDLDAPCSWMACEQIGSRSTVPLPAELVHLAWPYHDEAPVFGWSSNGLASGNTLEEATLHALFEVLERDAVAMNHGRDESLRIDNRTLPEPFAGWAADWARDGVELIVRHVPSVFGLPCFQAHVHEAASLDVNLAVGAGLHFDRSIALARAVTEAAQSRLSTVHGGRDDITRFYAKFEAKQPAVQQQHEQRVVELLRASPRTVSFDEAPHVAVREPAAALRRLLARMADRGFPIVLRRRLQPAPPRVLPATLHVVKLIVPGCEVLDEHNRRIGPRLRARVLGHG